MSECSEEEKKVSGELERLCYSLMPTINVVLTGPNKLMG